MMLLASALTRLVTFELAVMFQTVPPCRVTSETPPASVVIAPVSDEDVAVNEAAAGPFVLIRMPFAAATVAPLKSMFAVTPWTRNPSAAELTVAPVI
jgi:hypothetical protein